MMNNDNTITSETKLYGYIAENAHSSRFCVSVNKLYKANGMNAMAIPMNIRSDDLTFTISQMRYSKLSGAVIAAEYQEEVFALLDSALAGANEAGYCDFIRIENEKLLGELLMPRALEKYAERDEFAEDVALQSLVHYFVDITTGEKDESH